MERFQGIIGIIVIIIIAYLFSNNKSKINGIIFLNKSLQSLDFLLSDSLSDSIIIFLDLVFALGALKIPF